MTKDCINDTDEFLKEQLELLKLKQSDPNIEWQDVADFRSAYIGTLEHRDTCRKGSKLLYEYLDAGWTIEPKRKSDCTSTIVDFGAPTEKIALQKERVKVQTEKIELNRWIREYSRDEQIAQYIVNEISKLTPLNIPNKIISNDNKVSYALAYSDCHLGSEFELKGLLGETLNQYSPEIFEERMWNLLAKVKKIVEKENISLLHVWDFGDDIDGMLRVSQLFKLRYGVVEQTIKYADFISNWLNELSKIVNVKFQMVVDSNHSQLRMLGQQKNTFKDDNMSKVIITFIKERLKDNPNIEIVENPTGMIYDIVCGYNILGVHGEIKDMEKRIRELSEIYKTKINYLIGGHLHHSKSKNIGIDVDIINIPSIIGMDDYSLSLGKSANAGAKLFAFEEGNGKSIEYTIKLN